MSDKKGKRPSKRSYTDETKAAVIAALLEGQAIRKVAGDYKIPVGTVKNWKARAKAITSVEPEKQQEIGELLLGYVRQNLTTLRAQAEALADPEYVKSQDAAQIAVLHGVIADKTVRLLEAMSSPAIPMPEPEG